MKKFLSILLAVVLCFSVCSVAAFAAGEDIVVKAVPSKTTLNRGDTFTVDFNITANAGFNTLGLEVGYDNTVLEVVCPNHKVGSNCTGQRLPVTNMLEKSPDGAANNATNSKTHDVNPYKIMWAFGTAEEDVVDTGRIATLTFKVKADAKIGKTTISLEVDQAASIENGAYAAGEFAGVSADVNVACSTHIKNAGTVTDEANCTEPGVKAYVCTECGADMGTERIEPTGHNYSAWSETTPPKCEAEGEETRECVNADCDEKETRPVDPTGHSYGEWSETTPPKCEVKGEETRVCANDATHKETRPVNATGHAWGDWRGTADAKCGQKGEETRVCANDATHKETRDTDALEHLWDDGTITTKPTCTEPGEKTYTCTRDDCGATKPERIDPTGHSYGIWSVTTKPTCEGKGEETRVCANDANHKETRPVNPTGHTWGNWEVTTDPKCEDKGEETRVCVNDANHKETRPVDPTGHDFDYENPVVTKEPTCTEEGEVEYPCLNGCGEVETDAIDALGHTVDWTITKEPTVDEEGERTGVCDECGEEVTEKIPVLTNTLEGDKLGIIVVDPETGDVTEKPADGFKVESGDDEPFSGYVQGGIMAVTPEGEDAETVGGKTIAVSYVIALTNTDTEEIVDMDKVITLTIPVSNDILAAYENLVLIGVDENGEDVIIEGAEFIDGAFVVTGKYSDLTAVAVAGDKIVVEEDDDKDPIIDNEDDKDNETTSPATGDTAAIAFVIVMLAIAASVLVFTSKKVRA